MMVCDESPRLSGFAALCTAVELELEKPSAAARFLSCLAARYSFAVLPRSRVLDSAAAASMFNAEERILKSRNRAPPVTQPIKLAIPSHM